MTPRADAIGPVLATALSFAGAGALGHPFPLWFLGFVAVAGVMFVVAESRR